MHAQCTGELAPNCTLDPELAARLDELDSHNRGSFVKRFVPARRWPRLALSSPTLLWRGLEARSPQPLELTVCGLLGEGLLSTSSITNIVRAAAPRGWPERRLWVVACDLDRGERVVFGQREREHVPIHEAVSASTAIPGLFAPMRIEGRRLIDGGFYSASNLDLTVGQGLDAVLCIHPLAGAAAVRSRSVLSLSRHMRQRVDRRIAAERALVEAQGTPVYVLHPTAEELAQMPVNAMDFSARAAVMSRAARAVADTLAHAREAAPFVGLLRGAVPLPAGARATA
jgi:NTE family protein